MKSLLVLLVTLLIGMTTFAQAPKNAKEKDKAAILAIMAAQEASWNKGDLESFMIGYWEDERLKFIGKSGVTYGYEATLENYKKNYSGKEGMGTLAFDIMHVEEVGKKTILVVGKWQLQREKDAPGGHFSLIWKKMGKEWVIVADHSS